MEKIQINFVDIKNKLWNSKGLFILVFVALFMLGVSVFSVNETEANKNKEVLGVKTKNVLSVPSFSPTRVPSVTPVSTKPTLTITPTAIKTSITTPTPTSSSNNNSQAASTPAPSSAPTSTLTPTITQSPTPTPSPVGLSVQVGVDYAGQKSSDSYNVTLNPDQTAWDAVVAAIGIDNIKYTDYGGDMGKFITSFNGIDVGGNQYYEFRVNGVSSDIGASSYKCNDNDKLDFVLTTF